MLTAREARRLDRNAAALGVPVGELMANAGAALAAEVARVAKGRPAAFVCGKGHNGGDGLAAAGWLHRAGLPVRVVLAEPAARLAPACTPFLDALPAGLVESLPGDQTGARTARPGEDASACPVVVDCLLGTGASGEPRDAYRLLLGWMAARKRAGATLVACDVPSLLGSRHAVRPDVTVTFHDRKPGMTRATSGRVVVAPIGMPDAAAHIGPGDLEAAFVAPRADSHKGDNGVVALVAGGPYRGAPWYAGMAAYRTGADLVHAFLPAEAARVVESWGPEILVHGVEEGTHLTPDGVATVVRSLRERRPGAVVVGPGLGNDPRTREAARAILESVVAARIPCVVDADGLDALTPRLMADAGPRMLLTPHAREFRDLAGTDASEANVQRFASRHGTVVVRKSHRTFVTDGERGRTSHRGHATLTVGGTGDVLAGATAELLAKCQAARRALPAARRARADLPDGFDVACGAAYLLGRAGELAAGRRGYGATARDVLESIPAALLETVGGRPAT